MQHKNWGTLENTKKKECQILVRTTNFSMDIIKMFNSPAYQHYNPDYAYHQLWAHHHIKYQSRIHLVVHNYCTEHQ